MKKNLSLIIALLLLFILEGNTQTVNYLSQDLFQDLS